MTLIPLPQLTNTIQAAAIPTETMIVAKKSLLGLLALAAAASAAVEKVILNFLSDDELDYFKSIPVAPGDIGAAVVEKPIVKRILDARGGIVYSDETAQNDVRRSVAIKMITEATDNHEDCGYYADGKSTPMTEDDQVGFIFLDSNPDAAFRHGDDVVPASAGSLVTFKGKVPHNTVVTTGSVRLAGPFHLDTLTFVGPCNVDSDCDGQIGCGEGCCECDCSDVEEEDCDFDDTDRMLQTQRYESGNDRAARKLKIRAMRKLEDLHDAVKEEELKADPNIRGVTARRAKESKSKSFKSSKACCPDTGVSAGECVRKSGKSSKSCRGGGEDESF